MHYLSEISKSREKRILKMLWKCQIFPLRVPVVIEMCCCVGKCPVGSQKPSYLMLPSQTESATAIFLYECWVWYEKDGTCIIIGHSWYDKFNIFTSDPSICHIFQYFCQLYRNISVQPRAWTFTLRLNRRTRLLPYKLNLHLFFY